MLLTLLPGLREVRVSLLIGLAWLSAGWLLIADLLPPAASADGFFENVYRLLEIVGRPGQVALLLFVAYLIGIPLADLNCSRLVTGYFSLKDRTRHQREVHGKSKEAKYPYRSLSRLSQLEKSSIARFTAIIQRLQPDEDLGESSELTTILGLTHPQRTWTYLIRIVEELGELRVRLQLSERGSILFEEQDRLHSEGELRSGIAVPMLALVWIASVQLYPDVGPGWMAALLAAGTILAALLAASGIVRTRQANAYIIDALLEGVIESRDPTTAGYTSARERESLAPYIMERSADHLTSSEVVVRPHSWWHRMLPSHKGNRR